MQLEPPRSSHPGPVVQLGTRPCVGEPRPYQMGRQAERPLGWRRRGLVGRACWPWGSEQEPEAGGGGSDSLGPQQLVKKVVHSGDTAGLQPTLDVFRHEDRLLLQSHCHTRALSILRAKPSGVDREAHTREAIAYLSLAIFAAGRRTLPAQGSNPVPATRGTRG